MSISFQFHKNLNTPSGIRSIEQVVEAIKGDAMKSRVEPIRQAKERGEEELAAQLKKALPAFTASAHFSNRRKRENFQHYTGLIVLDIDHLHPEMVQPCKEAASNDEHALLVFISPSGTGIKIFVQVDSPVDRHKDAFEQVCVYFSKMLSVPFDEKVSDITRLTFMSYDENVYYNPQATTFKVKKHQVSKIGKVLKMDSGDCDYKAAYDQAYRFTEKRAGTYLKGNRNNFLYQLACVCNRYGISFDQLTWMLDWCDLPASEIEAVLKSAYSNRADFGSWQLKQKSISITWNSSGKALSSANNALHNSAKSSTPKGPSGELPNIVFAVMSLQPSQSGAEVAKYTMFSILSALMYKVKGVYNGSVVYPSLNILVTAPTGSGKGVISQVQKLFLPLHQAMVQDAEPFHGLFLADNTTTSALIKRLSDNDGRGVLFSSDVSFLGYAIKRDDIVLSALLKAGCSGERVTNGRSTKKGTMTVNNNRMVACLAATPKDLPLLFDDAEDGLIGRLLHYGFMPDGEWVPFQGGEVTEMLHHQQKLSGSIVELYGYLQQRENEFKWEEEQILAVDEWFGEQFANPVISKRSVVEPILKHLRIHSFKLCMVMSALRAWEENSNNSQLRCTADDFDAVMKMIQVFYDHACLIAQSVGGATASTTDLRLKKFYAALPDTNFDRRTALEIAKQIRLNISDRSIDAMLKQLVEVGMLSKEYNKYSKVVADTHSRMAA